MSDVNRRDFIRLSGLGAASAVTGLPAVGQKASAATTFNVVVIGGGLAGSTAARYINDWSKDQSLSVNVTLIERSAQYASPILSNLVLVGTLTKASLDFGYGALTSAGVNVVQGEVTAIDPASQSVTTASGQRYGYDRLVIAPGIDFDYTNSANQVVEGLEAAIASGDIIPAWKGGEELNLLRRQLEAMPSGGTWIQVIPPSPYRCPPGPYERACVVADYLSRYKGGGQVIVLDANAAIQAEKHTFETAFAAMGVTYIPSAMPLSVSVLSNGSKTVVTNLGAYTGNVLNYLPRQRAGRVLDLIPGVLAGGRFAPVHALTYESSVAGFEGVHVVGDAQGTAQPKAGHIGNGEAKVCADAILTMLQNGYADTMAYRNAVGEGNLPAVVTNSACYSPIKASTTNTASYLTVGYRADASNLWTPTKIGASLGEASSPTRSNYKRMFDWAENLFYDTFGIPRNIG